MSDDVTIREPRDGEDQALRRLLAESFGDEGVAWTRDVWSWKHENNPFGPSAALVAEAGGGLAALRLFLRWDLRVGSTRVPVVRAVDTVTHPDFRGRGLFSRLTRELAGRMEAEGVAFIYNTPNRSSRPGYLRLGWHKVGRIPLMVRPLRGGWTAPFRRHSASEPAAPELSHLPSVTTFLAAPEARGWDAAWSGDARFHTVRTLEYLQWRYAEIPDVDYRTLFAHRGGNRAALIFRARSRRGLAEVTLSEVLATPSPGGETLAENLLRRLARETNGDYLVAIAAQGTPERRALRRAGFWPLPWAGPLLTVRPLKPAPQRPDPRDWIAWRCSIGDLEVF